MNIQSHRASLVDTLLGYEVFFRHFEELATELPVEQPGFKGKDLKSKKTSIESQLIASKRFEKFLSYEREKVVTWMKSSATQSVLKQAQQIFDQTVLQSIETLAVFGKKSIEVIQGVEDGRLKLELVRLANEIISKGSLAIQSYRKRRDTLLLAGLFSVYKNELSKKKWLRIRFEDLNSPQILDMIKTVTGPVKVITDSLIPSFVELLHQKVVTPRLPGTPRELKPLCNSLSDNYQSRGFAKSQSQYFETYKEFHRATREAE